MKSIWFYILGAALLVALGFYFGRQTNDKVKIEYVKGEAIRDTVKIPYPAFTEIPPTPQLPMKPDTIYSDSVQIITEKVDTSAIIQDYILTRTYEFNVFNNDTLGKFDVRQKVGYNKLLSFDYIFTPMTRQTTRFKEPVFTPFITGGYSTNNSFLLGGGLYYRNLGIEYNYNHNQNLSQSYHTIKLNIKL